MGLGLGLGLGLEPAQPPSRPFFIIRITWLGLGLGLGLV